MRKLSAHCGLAAVFLALTHSPASAGFFNNTAFVSAMKFDREGDYQQARTKFEKLARADDETVACASSFKMFDYLFDGLGGAKDIPQAKVFLERVTHCKDRTWSVLADWRMGFENERGFGGALPIDRLEAYRYYKAGADLGDEKAKKNLVRLEFFPEVYVPANEPYFVGPRDEIAPMGWDAVQTLMNSGSLDQVRPALLWHARHGNENAQFALAMLLLNEAGEGALKQSGGWLLLAAKSGHASAQRDLGLYMIAAADAPPAEGYAWLKRSAAQGDAEAANHLGIYAEKPPGDSGSPDFAAAAEYYQKSIELGSAKAAANLALLYADGRGVPKDRDRAITLLKQAADAGLIDARAILFSRFNLVYGGDPRRQDRTPVPAAGAAQPALKVAPTSKEFTPVEIFRANSPSVFMVAAGSRSSDDISQGSAVAIGPSTIATNCHVTKGMEAYGVFVGGRLSPLRPSGANQAADICTYSLSISVKPVSQIRPYASLEIGEKVYAIGSPRGLQNTFSEGIISGLRNEKGHRIIQTTVPITHGSSGGGLFDAQGRLIGITSKGIEGTGNLNFAVSIEEAP